MEISEEGRELGAGEGGACSISLGLGKKGAKMGPSAHPGAGWTGSGTGSQPKLTGGQELLGLGWEVVCTIPCLCLVLRRKSAPPQLLCPLTPDPQTA